MFRKILSAATYGIESKIITVEADISDGLPQFSMVGYLASEVREAQDRVRTAIRNSGIQMQPRRITVNLAPADIRKSGSGFDLPIAVTVMSAYGYIEQEQLEGVFMAGELSLDGSILGIHGVLGMVAEAKKAGCTSCIVPAANAREGAVISGIRVYGAKHLSEVAAHLRGEKSIEQVSINIEEKFTEQLKACHLDFSEIKGQHFVKRAAEIAAAGMHNLLISGPPGAGKTMIARRIPGILPPMDLNEALEVSQIHSVAGILPENGILTQRPFRMPHHTISAPALAGGGMIPRPGEISLAHRGVLYLDEIPEFQRDTLEILRQPMEEGEVRIGRNCGHFVFPAEFMLIASRNPCKCGYYPDRKRCRCSEMDVLRYAQRISRPLLDRIDIYAEAAQMEFDELTGQEKEESSLDIRRRVWNAHQIQKTRYKNTSIRFNSELSASELTTYCLLDAKTESWMKKIYTQKQMTARSYHKVIKVARTIADLDQSREIRKKHISEAVLFRPTGYYM